MKSHNTNLIFKPMNNMNTIFNYRQGTKKFGAITMLLLALLVSVGIQAQTSSGADKVADADKAGVSVKLIDNKGTIKYLQSNNGITTITSTEANNKTRTTWQLGGSLVDNTYIDADGSVFSLDGLKLETGTAATTAVTQSGHAASTSGNTTLSTNTGYTIVVRDEATGEIKKLLASNLVTGIHYVAPAQAGDAAGNVAITVSGIPVIAAGSAGAFKVSVYRNGAKLIIGTDFLVTANTVTIQYDATNLPIYAGDIFEVHYIN